MLNYLWIGFGSALGGMARHGLSSWMAVRWGETFPLGTIAVNVTGSFLIGLLAVVIGPERRVLIAPDVRQFILVGILGGYTTFSSFSLQTLNLARDGQWLLAGANVVLSVVLCLAGVWLGHALGVQLNG